MNKLLCDKEWLRKTENTSQNLSENQLNIVDLFCGCGGLSLGVIEACKANNITPIIKFALDQNSEALNIYRANLKDYINNCCCGLIENYIDEDINENISNIEKKFIEEVGRVDMLLAGPPCQGHSRLNNYTRSNDPRNLLYLNAIRFIEIFKPNIALIENVKNIVNDKNNVVYRSQLVLEKLGYTVQNLIIDTSKYGIAQNRIRHIQVATKMKINLELNYYESYSALSDVIDDLVDEDKYNDSIFTTSSKISHMNRVDYLFDNNLYDLPDELRPDCHKNKKHTYPTCYGRLKWDQPSTTITRGFSTMGQGRFLHPLRKRTLTPHEAVRIQGFPDFYDFSSVKKRKDLHLMIANAVPPRISAIIIDKILSSTEVKNG